MRRVEVEERRARLGRRHLLAPGAQAGDVVDAARAVVGLHATDPATVYLSARARIRDARVEAIEDTLYEERRALKMLGMRRTMFVVPVETAPVVQAACTDAIAARLRRRLIGWLEESGVAKDGAKWLEEVEGEVERALAQHGELAGAELSRAVPALQERILFNPGKKYEARQSVATLLMPVISAEGRVARGRPRGSWISSQHRWAPMDAWLPEREAAPAVADAQAELVRLWLRAFGPGTLADLKWWTGLGAGVVRKALEAADAVEVELGAGEPGYLLLDDLEPVATPDPWVALLPSLDATTMGWAGRDWYLGEHREMLFDGNGNAGPTVWADGHIVGGWAQRRDGEVVVRYLEDAGAEAEAAVAAEAERVREWLGDVRITARFPVPLQRELVA